MPSRREAIEMTPDERRAYLRTQPRLILVSNGPDGFPHPMPMNFLYDDQDRFVVTTFRKSQKTVNFTRDRRASLLVESGLDYTELKSVLAYAEAEIIDDREVTFATMAALSAKEQGLGNSFDIEAVRAQIEASMPKRVVLRFAPTRYISWDHAKLGGVY